jgi:hypothetical protein
MEMAPDTDGAVAMILASEEKARQITDRPVWVSGLGTCYDAHYLGDRDLSDCLALTRAAERAYKMAGIANPGKEVDLVELGDEQLAQLVSLGGWLRGTEALTQVVMKNYSRDGAELLTVRYPLAERGALRTYAGAGLNRAVYFGDDDGVPMMLTRRNRQSSLGAAAEVGAELQVSRQLMVSADLRWADLDDDAVLLRADDGYVGADPVAVGVSVGWRFR